MNDLLQGDIQQLLIIDDPKAAYDYCEHYMTDCDKPTHHMPQAQDPQVDEVRSNDVLPLYIIDRDYWDYLCIGW